MAADGRAGAVRGEMCGSGPLGLSAGIPGAADAAAGHVGPADGGGADNLPSGPAAEMAPNAAAV